MEEMVRKILVELGEDPEREGLNKTPHRVATALRALTSGYRENAEEIIKSALFTVDNQEIVLVRDMWLTGFDTPCLHTMYLDKPMRGHGLMQTIARVNRVFKDKPGGLVVDYLGLAQELKQALATYTESGGTGKTAIDQDEAVALPVGFLRGVGVKDRGDGEGVGCETLCSLSRRDRDARGHRH